MKKTKDERHAYRELAVARLDEGCADCGITDLRVLQFDHVRGTKVAAVSWMISTGRSIATVTAEMDKCEVRCANCHIIATLERLGGTWHDRYRDAPLLSAADQPSSAMNGSFSDGSSA
ncbi:MAG: hypothetical protein ABWY36_08335 [Leifsonia sp.]